MGLGKTIYLQEEQCNDLGKGVLSYKLTSWTQIHFGNHPLLRLRGCALGRRVVKYPCHNIGHHLHNKDTHDHQPDHHLNKLILSFPNGICMYSYNTSPLDLDWILGSTILKFLYFHFGMGSKLWDLLCSIPSEEGKGFLGVLTNRIKPHNSIALRNILYGKASSCL